MYRCGECGAAAEVVYGEIYRTCDHDGCVIADARSEMRGAGGVL